MTIQEAARLAIQLQGASNLSGVVKAYPSILEAIWDEAHRRGKGTAFINEHPITKAIVSKLVHLSKYEDGGTPFFGEVAKLAEDKVVKNYLVDVAFSVEGPWETEADIPQQALLDGMAKRLDYLLQNPSEGADAFGFDDSYVVAD